MEGNYLKITDTVTFSFLNPDLMKVKDNMYSGLADPRTGQNTTPQPQGHLPGTSNAAGGQIVNTTSGLIVRVAATHAGIITGNNTFYLPDKVSQGAATWTQNYPKPILLHHDEERDPIGRVVGARYVDISHGLADKFRNKDSLKDKLGKNFDKFNDKLIRDFCDGKMPYSMQIDVVRTILDNALLDDPSYEGLGYIELTANITDKEAIEKFLDGRYLTGSVSASTDRAVCSICKNDWTKDGMCEHTPGKLYDGKKMYLIAGNFQYSEYSIVNRPADRHSKVLELYYNGVRDSIDLTKDSGRIPEVTLGFPQYETTKEDDLMANQATIQVVDSEGNTPAPETPAPAETQVTDGQTQVQDTESAEDFVTRVLDAEKISDEDANKIYQLMLDEMKALGLSDKEIEDAKLSPEKRAKLPKSSFGGPNRTLPLTDCAHVAAAKSLVAKHKDAGKKDSVMAVVNRKAKALGCKAKDKVEDKAATQVPVKDSVVHSQVLKTLLDSVGEIAQPSNPSLNDEEMTMLRTLVRNIANLVGKDNIAKVSGLEKLGLDSVAEKVFCDEISVLEETVGSLRDELTKLTEERDALREEYNALFEEMNAMQDSVVSAKAATRQAKLAKLRLLMDLKDGKVEDKREETLAALTDEVIDSQLTELTVSVDIKKITDKLGDGMSRTPTGGVENPSTVVQDNNRAKLTKQELDEIETQYMKLRFIDSARAEAYRSREIERLRKEGKLPRD